MLLSAVQLLTDRGIYPWTSEDLARRARAFLNLIEQQLKAAPGSFKFLMADSTIFKPFNFYQTVHEIAAGLEIGYTGFSCVCPSILIAYETQVWSDQEGMGILNLGGLVARFQLGY